MTEPVSGKAINESAAFKTSTQDMTSGPPLENAQVQMEINSLLGTKSLPSESASDADIFWQGKGVKVKMPTQPVIPRDEGLQFVVASDSGDKSWKDGEKPVKDVLRETFFVLPVARVVSESYASPDYWANIQLKSVAGADEGVNVLGRNPRSEAGWAKPPGVKDSQPLGPLPNADVIKELMSRYIPLWDEVGIELFPAGVNEVEEGSDEFSEVSQAYPGDVLWMNDKYIIDVVRKPHLSGIHMVVSQRDKAKEQGAIKRPWQVSTNLKEVPSQRQDFLEEMAIILSAQRVLWQEGVPYYNPEIQFNGNWTPTMKPEEKGGSLDLESVETMGEKRSHRQHREKDWNAGTHGHLYAMSSQEDYVSLPSRPEAEVPEEWEGIVPAKLEEIERLRSILQSKLTPYIQQNAGGSL